jgi:hypothetical protein
MPYRRKFATPNNLVAIDARKLLEIRELYVESNFCRVFKQLK